MVRLGAIALDGRQRFCLILLKPSHYDDDGYVIQWLRSPIPANSLACLYGIAQDCAERQVLGPGIALDIHAYDETNTRIRPARLAAMIEAAGAGMVMLVGVQSNQFPRALDIARPLRQRGIQVGIGGFHVSGVLSMLDGKDPDLDRARAMGVSLFAGEAEGRLGPVLRDAMAGTLAPLYNHMNDLPSLDGAPIPLLAVERVQRTAGATTSFDAGRGCPYQCSFCTIINVQGRKSRFRSPDDLEKIVRENYAQGIKRFFITDDNFARNRHWEALLDRMIALRVGEGLNIGFTIQVDTLCHKIPNFIEKATKAGVRRVFIGLENINPDNLLAANKRQNKITEYRIMLQKWRAHGAITYAGYILGFPGDTKESIKRDIEIIKRELPLDILEFFFLTPLPGSEDHKTLAAKGVWMDPDMNKYDLNHRVSHHAGRMSDAEWEDAYRTAWETYYTPEHVRTILRRVAANPLGRTKTTLTTILWFYLAYKYEGVHPLEAGMFRLKFRRDRRPSLRRESPFVFYPRYIAETLIKAWRAWSFYRTTRAMLNEIEASPQRRTYTDLAIAPPQENEFETLALYHATSGGEAALVRKRRDEAIRAGADAAVHARTEQGAAAAASS
jgi:Radical SAM superfamily